MATLAPIATQALGLFKTVGTVASVLSATNVINNRSADASLRHLQDKQKLEERNATQSANLSRQQLQAQTAEAEAKRRNDLKRAVARQRASFGGAGISSNGGSSEAVLLGLFDESEEQRANRERLDNIRFATLDQQLGNTKRVNTLERTQAESKNSLSRTLTARDGLNDLIDTIF